VTRASSRSSRCRPGPPSRSARNRRTPARATLAAALLAAACARSLPVEPVLRVGTSGDYPPFSVARDGNYEGLDVDVARRFAHDAGRRLEIVRFRWPDLVADLAAGRFDVAMGGVTMRPERAVVGTFTRPVTRAGVVVVARGPLDGPRVRLAVNAGGHLERVARRLFPDARLVRTTDNRLLASLVTSGDADGVVTDEVEAAGIIAALPGAVEHGPFTRDAKAYLARDPAVVAELDAWLRAREADGALADLRARWVGPARADRRSPAAADLDAVLALIDLRLAFMPPIAAAKRAAGRDVDDPGQETRVLEAARASAVRHGLDPAGVESLFRALIDAARAVQRDFLAHPWPVETIDLERAARPAVARVSELVIARAADLAADGAARASLDPARVAEGLDPLTPAADRLAIARALLACAMTSRSGRVPEAQDSAAALLHDDAGRSR
jgi:cyclohexadienyl dehydratase